MEGCDWNPDADRAAYEDEPHARTAQATWSVGVRPNWHLCDGCAALPRFARMKKTPLRPRQLPPPRVKARVAECDLWSTVPLVCPLCRVTVPPRTHHACTKACR